MDEKVILFRDIPRPLSEEDEAAVIASLTALLNEPKLLVDGNVYDHILIEEYFDLDGKALNTPDGSISLYTETTGDIAVKLRYGMSEGMLHKHVRDLVPGNFKVKYTTN